MLKGFRDFILRGNVVDLAVAVIIGGAFNKIVTSVVSDLITPFIGVFGGEPNFSGVYFTINKSRFLIGDLLNAVISFVIVAGVIYFFIIVPMNQLTARIKKQEKVDLTDKTCPECLSLIPLKAKRCKFCTSVVK